MPVAAAVLVAASLHATWNALVKSVGDRLALMALMGMWSIAICVPVALFAPAPLSASWPELASSMVLHNIYNLLLIESYREGDYNQVYPIARGIAPPAVAVASVVVVGESLSALQTAGVVTVSAGLLVIASGSRYEPKRALAFAVLTGLVIAAYTVVDGVGVRRAGSVVGYATWLFVGMGAGTALIWVLINRRMARPSRIDRDLVPRAAVADVLSLAAYGLVLWAQTRGALAVVAALRETSVVFAAAIGAAVFHEHLPARRILGSVVIAAGAAALALG
jgi:drug/metabolite transporter (DMT)-like permease